MATNTPGTVAVVLRIGSGGFATGFPITLRILEDGRLIQEDDNCLVIPPAPDLPHLYQTWQLLYRQLGETRGIKAVPGQVTHRSMLDACQQALQELSGYLDTWFAQAPFRSLRHQIIAETRVQHDHAVPVIIDVDLTDANRAEMELLRHIPWHLWDLFDASYLPNAEVVLAMGKKFTNSLLPSVVKILAVFGSSEGGLDLERDRQALEKLHQRDAKVTQLHQPSRQKLHEHLWNYPWDILFFGGHSASEAGYRSGYLQISDRDSLSLDALREDLNRAVANGLKLAIFNSCDGLGIASYLADLQVPYRVVMREPVPDRVAREFLQEFLQQFAQGIPLYLAVRRSRSRLHWMESDEQHPCPAASWLPIVCQNSSQPELVWAIKPHHILSRILPGRSLMAIRPSQKQETLRPMLAFLIASGILGALVSWVFKLDPNPNSGSPDVILLQSGINLIPPFSHGDRQAVQFTDVNTVPAPGASAFRFAGSTASAAMLCSNEDKPGNGGMHAQILAVHPQFRLDYVLPETGAPNSGKGIALLMNNKVDFVLSSRLPKLDEDQQARDQNFELKSIQIAQYATAYSVHPEIGIGAIGGLTINELGAIFTSDVPLNWQQFRGSPQQISPYVHEAERGALYIGERLFGRFGAIVNYVETTTSGLQAVASDFGGIYRAPAVLSFGQKTTATLPIINSRGEPTLPFTDPDFNPLDACKRLNTTADSKPAPINPNYPSELQEPLYVIVKDYPGAANLQERAGRAYADLLLTEQGQAMLNAIGFQGVK